MLRRILVNYSQVCSCSCFFKFDDVVIRFFSWLSSILWKSKCDLNFDSFSISSCNVWKLFVIFSSWTSNQSCFENDASFKWLCLKKEWVEVAFAKRRRKTDLSHRVELILSHHFIKNDANWNFSIKCAFRHRSNKVWQFLWRLTCCALCKNWVKHYKHCAHWFIFRSSF
jgi:hypothetical protein